MRLDERTKRMMETYIPSPRDEGLGFDEYYLLQYTNGGERVIKVYVRGLMPHEDGIEYSVYTKSGRVDAGYGDPYRGFRKADLYDNKEDCRRQTHLMYDGWEKLREIQGAEHEDNQP